jgi:hypothetical protein
MLNGACRGLLSILSPESRQVFDAKLKHILSSSNTGQNSMLMLWCFGITILAEHPEAIEASPTLNWETASGRKLFASDVNKTVSLAYLNVIWAAKGDVGVSDDEALEGIRIATRTLRLIDKSVRERWPTSGDFAKNMFAKLPSKILRRGISPTVQLAALSFHAMIAGENNLAADLVNQYEAALPKLLVNVDPDFLRECLSSSLPLFAVSPQDKLSGTYSRKEAAHGRTLRTHSPISNSKDERILHIISRNGKYNSLGRRARGYDSRMPTITFTNLGLLIIKRYAGSNATFSSGQCGGTAQGSGILSILRWADAAYLSLGNHLAIPYICPNLRADTSKRTWNCSDKETAAAPIHC